MSTRPTFPDRERDSLPQMVQSASAILGTLSLSRREASEVLNDLNATDFISIVFGIKKPHEHGSSRNRESSCQTTDPFPSQNSSGDNISEFLKYWIKFDLASQSNSAETISIHQTWDDRLRNRILVIRDIYIKRRNLFLKDFAKQWQERRQRFCAANNQLPVADKSVEVVDQVMLEHMRRVFTSLQVLAMKQILYYLGMNIESVLDTRPLLLSMPSTSGGQQTPTPQQLQILETEFFKNPYWTKLQQKMISEKSCIPMDTVVAWYQRRSAPTILDFHGDSSAGLSMDPSNYFPEYLFADFSREMGHSGSNFST